MSEQFDLNEAAAKFASNFAADIYEKSVKKITRSISLSGPVISSSIAKFIAADSDRLERIRTIISENPVRLSKIYQPLYFNSTQDIISENQLKSVIDQHRQVTIKGGAGAGKSMFMKRHFLKRISEKIAVPIFIELRAFSTSSAENFFAFLFDSARSRLPWLEIETFRAMLQRGQIELLLDALDEVSHAKRAHASASITALINEFPKARLIVTTRFGDLYATIPTASEYKIRPFSKDQSISLINNLDFDADVKDRFVTALNDGLFEKHSDLLSNPLLCSLMLLTYRRHSKIPDRLHLYYQQAYEVLFSRHDASKNYELNRDILSKLDVAQMQRVLDYISAVSYACEDFEFSEVELLNYISEAIETLNLDCTSSSIKEDLIEAVSMIVRDGLEMKFAHRSFQEYFCAHYISTSSNDTASGCIDAVKQRIDTDNVIDIAYALNPERFEEAWLEPNLERDLARWEAMIKKKDYKSVILDAGGSAKLDRNGLHITFKHIGLEENSSLYRKFISENQTIPMIISVNTTDISKQPSNSSRQKTSSPTSGQFPNKSFELLSRAFPNHVNSWQRGEIPGGDPLSIDLTGRIAPHTYDAIATFPVWESSVTQAADILRDWLKQVRARRRARGSSALSAFRKAAKEGSSLRARKHS